MITITTIAILTINNNNYHNNDDNNNDNSNNDNSKQHPETPRRGKPDAADRRAGITVIVIVINMYNQYYY